VCGFLYGARRGMNELMDFFLLFIVAMKIISPQASKQALLCSALTAFGLVRFER
jgi:hypothetical protein